MLKNKYKILPLLLLLTIGFLSIRLFVLVVPAKTESADIRPGIEYLSSVMQTNTQNTAPTTVETEQTTTENKVRQNIETAIKKGNFNYAFKETVISGDSIVKAIDEYDLLDSTRVIAEIGASTHYLASVTDEIVAAKPKYLILHYGENEVGGKDYSSFIKRYTECVKKLKKELPHTEIYIDSIFPVSDKALEREPYLKYIGDYNAAMKNMAIELGVHYIDFDAMWQGFEKNYYDADGIHPLRSFYTEQYLLYILKEVGY